MLGGEGRGGGLTIVIVVADDDLLQLAELAHLAPEVLVEGVEVHLELLGVELGLGVVRRVLVQVGQQDGLRVGRLDVLARAAVAVAARADLVVEGAVDLVLLGAEDGGEVVRHCGVGVVWGARGRVLCWRGVATCRVVVGGCLLWCCCGRGVVVAVMLYKVEMKLVAQREYRIGFSTRWLTN